MPKITVIIPNYKHARFLERRIQSVLDQTYQDFEIILLDDASPDNSVEILSRFAQDPRVYQTIFNEVNSGSTFKQWNKGISQARGEYIWLAESDDYADKNLLENLVQPLDSNPNVGVSYCQSWAVDTEERILFSLEDCTNNLDSQRWKQNFFNSGQNECSQYLIFQNTIPNASAVVFRKSVYEQVGGSDEDLRLSGDWMLWVKMLMVSDLAFLAEPFNYFRKHSSSVRNQSIKSGLLLQEYLQLTGYILQRANVSSVNKNASLEDLINRWVSISTEYKWDISLNFKVYQAFSKIDPHLNRRLASRTFKKAVKVLLPS